VGRSRLTALKSSRRVNSTIGVGTIASGLILFGREAYLQSTADVDRPTVNTPGMLNEP